jgi:hypothetical protein
MNRIRSCLPKRAKQVYVLELESGKYYVGESNNPKNRIRAHFEGRGALYTRLYPTVQAIQPFTKKQGEFWELSETIQRMGYHGIDNVRGSLFTKEHLTSYEKVMAAQLYCEMNNLCRKCGSSEHFMNQCISLNKQPWVYRFGGLLSFEDISECTTI